MHKLACEPRIFFSTLPNLRAPSHRTCSIWAPVALESLLCNHIGPRPPSRPCRLVPRTFNLRALIAQCPPLSRTSVYVTAVRHIHIIASGCIRPSGSELIVASHHSLSFCMIFLVAMSQFGIRGVTYRPDVHFQVVAD